MRKSLCPHKTPKPPAPHLPHRRYCSYFFNSGENPVTINDLLLSEIEAGHKQDNFCLCPGLVEAARIELASENIFTQLSSGKDSLLHSRLPPPTVRLRN